MRTLQKFLAIRSGEYQSNSFQAISRLSGPAGPQHFSPAGSKIADAVDALVDGRTAGWEKMNTKADRNTGNGADREADSRADRGG